MATQTIHRNLGKPIATGGTAEVYDWEPGWVLKLYFDRFGPQMAVYEHRIATAICATGLLIPAVGEIVYVDGRVGLPYQKCAGEPMGEDLARHPWRLVSYAIALANLHAKMHNKPLQADVPSLRSKLEHKIRDAKLLPEHLRFAVLKALETMPDGDRLCHGDFHIGNIMLGQAEPIIIDWIDASIGNPIADVARTSILTRGMVEVEPQFSRFQRFGLRIMYAVYLFRYFQLRPGGQDEYHRWLPIIAAGRLNENIPGWDAWLLAEVNKLL